MLIRACTNPAIFHLNGSVGVRGQFQIVSYHDHGQALLLAEILQYPDNLGRPLSIEVPDNILVRPGKGEI